MVAAKLKTKRSRGLRDTIRNIDFTEFKIKASLATNFFKSPAMRIRYSDIIKNDAETKSDLLINNVVHKMGTMFSTPEEYIIKMDSEADGFYLLIRGECTIELRDKDQQVYTAEKLIVENQHFGEIALIYKCKRTASVLSRNYITMARINRTNFNAIAIDYPDIKRYMMKHLYTYREERKSWIRGVIRKIDYLKDVTKEQFHEILYNLEARKIEKGENLYKEQQKCMSFFIVEKGELEAYVNLDGNDFIIERIPKGTIVNSRLLITEDPMMIRIRANQPTYLLEFTKDLQFTLMDKYKDLNMKFLKYNDILLKQGRSQPLDIIFSPQLCICKNNKLISVHRLRRENILKNIVIQELDKVRIQKLKPKLSDVLNAFK